MKISELITELERMKDLYGDVPVFHFISAYKNDVRSVAVDTLDYTNDNAPALSVTIR